eukprot:Hpha_TRINITY_DN21007_c0_g1::TRINITY_DN21007_c0_g1_i1::g.103372::m.103372
MPEVGWGEAMSRRTLPLFVRKPDGELLAINPRADGTVKDFAKLVRKALGTQECRLSFQGSVLDEKTLLADTGVSAQAVLELWDSVRPMGWDQCCGALRI